MCVLVQKLAPQLSPCLELWSDIGINYYSRLLSLSEFWSGWLQIKCLLLFDQKLPHFKTPDKEITMVINYFASGRRFQWASINNKKNHFIYFYAFSCFLIGGEIEKFHSFPYEAKAWPAYNCSTCCNASDCRCRGCKFEAKLGHITFVKIDSRAERKTGVSQMVVFPQT